MDSNNLPYHNKQGFEVPEGYFEEFENEILGMVNIAETLNSQEPDIIKDTGLKVPEGYFEELDKNILSKTIEPKVVPLFSKRLFYYVAGITAIFAAVFGSAHLTPSVNNSWDSVELSVMENYINEGYIELTQEDISEFIGKDGELINDTDFSNVNSEAAMEYLDENMEDPTYILE